MIKFDKGRFTAYPANDYCWILTEYYEGKDKHKKPKTQKRETYHSKLESVCKAVIEKSARRCQDAQDLLDLLKDAERRLFEVVNE